MCDDLSGFFPVDLGCGSVGYLSEFVTVKQVEHDIRWAVVVEGGGQHRVVIRALLTVTLTLVSEMVFCVYCSVFLLFS